MKLNDYYSINNEEKPLDNLVVDGGFVGIFRKMAFVGDSLSSGEFEALDAQGKRSYHDMYEYSWGQYIARMCGNTAYNFSRGGMTAKEYCESFAEENGFWDKDKAPAFAFENGWFYGNGEYPTHEEEGVKTYTCTGCGHTYDEKVPVLTEHSWGEWVINKLDNNVHIHYCICGEYETAPHNFDSGVITKEATHTETGFLTYTCADCEYSYGEEIAANSCFCW